MLQELSTPLPCENLDLHSDASAGPAPQAVHPLFLPCVVPASKWHRSCHTAKGPLSDHIFKHAEFLLNISPKFNIKRFLKASPV